MAELVRAISPQASHIVGGSIGVLKQKLASSKNLGETFELLKEVALKLDAWVKDCEAQVRSHPSTATSYDLWKSKVLRIGVEMEGITNDYNNRPSHYHILKHAKLHQKMAKKCSDYINLLEDGYRQAERGFLVEGEMELKDFSRRVAKLHELEEDAGGLSLLVSTPEKVGASYTNEVEVEILEEVISTNLPLKTRIELMNKDVKELPESPDCPNLTSLFSQNNSDLTSIPASFFELMPNLKEVDLSNTSIKSLPRSFFDLVSLQKLFLRNCQVFVELPAEIGQLHNLEVLDLEGTDIIQLPAEIGDLINLTCLKVLFCQCSGDLGEATIVPEGVLSKLAQLVELCIDVDPEDSRWEGAVQVVIKELVHLKKLEYLRMYLPEVELLDELTTNLSFSLGSSRTGFNLNVGSHMRRFMSTTPLGAEGKSEYMKKHLRYVNGKGSIPSQMKNLLKYSDALFLDRHFTVTNLSEFGMHNMENLRYCMLGECNELQTIVQGTDDDDDDDDDSYKNPVLPELQQLIIYSMKTLTSIYNAPLKDNSLCCLTTLKLHGCAQLREIFIFESGIALDHLEEITVEDCPAVLSLITCSTDGQIGWSFPKLKKISLHYLTELQSIFGGLCNAPNLERLSVYDCPNLKTLSAKEISRVDGLKVIRGEEEWWEALELNESEWEEDWLQKLVSVFVPIRSDADLETQLAQDPIISSDADLETQLAQDPIIRSGADLKTQSAKDPIPETGGEDEMFFSSIPWLDSDCEDDFYSINGDFTPSRGNTPPRVFSGGQTPSFISDSEPSSTEKKKKKLVDLYRERIRRPRGSETH